MHIILGATGHIGSVVAKILLGEGEPVTVVTRDESKRNDWEQAGAQVAVADVREVETLRAVLQKGKKLFLLNPPATPDTDINAEERKNFRSILSALEGTSIDHIVAVSTYGAQPGEGIGDLGVLYEMEQALSEIHIPTSVIRGAYYLSNWDSFLQSADNEGKIYSFYPSDFKLPMVAPKDIGQLAAELMTREAENRLYHIEGPEHYSPGDVAAAFSGALEKPVVTEVLKRHDWVPFMTKMGFSEKAAHSMAAMTDLAIQQTYELSNAPVKGDVTLQQYISELAGTLAAH